MVSGDGPADASRPTRRIRAVRFTRFSANYSGEPRSVFLSGTTPTTFKIGKCEAVTETKAEMQVQLYWREDGKTDQKEVFAELTRTNDRWLIEKVESR